MLDLTKLSFEDLVEQLKNRLREKDAWKDVYLSSTGTVLIELFAYVFQLMLYYLKRTYEEQFPRTAQFWQSMVRVANMLNLYVKRPQGAYGKVLMRLRDTAEDDTLFLSKYTMLLCDGVKCYTCEDVVLMKSDWTEVSVRQGDRIRRQFVGIGGDVQEYVIEEQYASDRDVVVSVNNVAYEVMHDLFDRTTLYSVRLYTAPDKSMRLMFTKDFGVPEEGAYIDVEYAIVDPAWLPKQDSDWFLSEDVEVRLSDISTWVAGSDFEDLESFRHRFRNFFGVGKRLVTAFDFERVVQSLGEVEKVKVIDVKDEFKAPFRGVVLCVKLKDSWDIPADFRKMFEETILHKIGLLGTKVDIIPPSKVDVEVYLVVERRFGYSTNQIVSFLTNEITKLYKNAEIGKWISREDLYSLVTRHGFALRRLVLPDKDLLLKDTQLVNLRALRVEVR